MMANKPGINGYRASIKHGFFGILMVAVLAGSILIIFTKTKIPSINGYRASIKESINPTTIRVRGKTIAVEIADSPRERRLGLSGRESLPPGTGLLFIFDAPDYHSFWMKDMNFPIDILWLDENYQIVDSWLNADPASYPKSVAPKIKAIYVLETNPGEIPISTYQP